MSALYLLHESASGFALFERVKSEEVGTKLEEVQQSITDLKRFSSIVKLKGFAPFTSAESALENINKVSEGEVSEYLANFLEMNLPKVKKGDALRLGVYEPKLGAMINETLGFKCESTEMVQELLRGIRFHFNRFLKVLKPGDLHQASLGLAHSYSRAKVKFNVHKVDNMIIQAIALLDTLDKDLNTFSMRVREWYGYHFPEMVKIVGDNYTYCRLAHAIKDRTNLTEEMLPQLEAIVNDASIAQQIVEASKRSMGQDIAPVDLVNIDAFATRVVHLTEYRKSLYEYLSNKMNLCAPNLSALVGEQVGARLISHAGSLTNLAKAPASTVQILGAEKALFRALKTKGNTPKYGLIFHSSFIGRAGAKNKGRISRYLANKCSIASRIDSFSDVPTNKFGMELKQQVEERLEFYKSGVAPRKNVDVMAKVLSTLGDAVEEDGEAEAPKPKKEKKNKRKAEEEPVAMEEDEAPKKQKKEKKEKKEKKSKKEKA